MGLGVDWVGLVGLMIVNCWWIIGLGVKGGVLGVGLFVECFV